MQSFKEVKPGKPEETPFSDKKKAETERISSTSAPVTSTPLSDALDGEPMKGKGKKLGKPLKSSTTSSSSSRSSDAVSEATPEHRADPNTPKADNDLPLSTPKSGPTQRSFIDEEDINAEVDARLAAKELKRARKKQAKKRKRDSVASDIFSPDPKAEPEHRVVLPAKKKARIDKPDVDDGKGKRLNVDDAFGSKTKAKKQKFGAATEKAEAAAEANKAKRRRSSNVSVVENIAAPEVNNRQSKKRRVGS